ncbi:MAG TPA: zinc ribbon domain-containing protein [Bacillota bacterium]|nr:zinc ribbon domain-containing protein [Bacillota bacterium]
MPVPIPRQCPACGAPASERARFCDQCGSPLPAWPPPPVEGAWIRVCPHCGTISAATAVTCPQCHERLFSVPRTWDGPGEPPAAPARYAVQPDPAAPGWPRRGPQRWLAGVAVLCVFAIGIFANAGYIRQAAVQRAVTVGSHFEPATFAVSGTPVAPGEDYAVLRMAGTTFAASSLTVLVEQRAGQGWLIVDRRSVSVDPSFGTQEVAFALQAGGVYRVSFLRGTATLGSATFRAVAPARGI